MPPTAEVKNASVPISELAILEVGEVAILGQKVREPGIQRLEHMKIPLGCQILVPKSSPFSKIDFSKGIDDTTLMDMLGAAKSVVFRASEINIITEGGLCVESPDPGVITMLKYFFRTHNNEMNILRDPMGQTMKVTINDQVMHQAAYLIKGEDVRFIE
jgi:hypothetical protein